LFFAHTFNPVLNFLETWYDWRKIMPALAQHYTVIAPDMRGLGESSIPADGDYNKKTVADDIYKLVQSLGMRHVLLVAQDMSNRFFQVNSNQPV
jgi:pimeloyl-ACP methyl ester carboxylesterase